jgi:hypothetical protein
LDGGFYRWYNKTYIREKKMKTFKELIEGFTPDQIQNLRKEFGKIDRVDPTSPTMQKLTKLIKGMSDEDLEEVKKAKIPFVSGIALSEIVMRRFR